jgi:hypothetical protein
MTALADFGVVLDGRAVNGGDDRGAGAAGVTRSRAALGGAPCLFFERRRRPQRFPSVKPTPMLSFAGMPIAAVQQ